MSAAEQMAEAFGVSIDLEPEAAAAGAAAVEDESAHTAVTVTETTVAAVQSRLSQAGVALPEQTIRRFSAHHENNIDRIVAHGLDHDRWRKAVGLDNLKMIHVRRAFEQEWLIWLNAHDKHGRPILLLQYKNYHPPPALTAVDALLMFLYASERALSAMETPERKLEPEICAILDFGGWSMAQRDERTMTLILETMRDNFPKILGFAYIVDAPWYMVMVWNIVRRFTSNALVSLIKFCKSHEHLVSKMGAASVPKYLGGEVEVDSKRWIQGRLALENVGEEPANFELSYSALCALHIAEIPLSSLQSNIRLQGMLWRRGEGGIMESKKWTERFMVLTTDGMLYHFDSSKDKGSAGGRYRLSTAIILDEVAPDKPHSWLMQLPSRSMVFAASSDAKRKEWIDALRSFADKRDDNPVL